MRTIPFNRWKKPRDIRWVRVPEHKGKGFRLGEGAYGTVVIGRMRFKSGGKIRRVAVKLFRNQLNDQQARTCQEKIEALARAGVRMPKMGMVKLENGEWAQVSELFGSVGKKSKFRGNNAFKFEQTDVKESLVEQLIRICNAGYVPTIDCFAEFSDPQKGIFVLDLDNVYKAETSRRVHHFFEVFYAFVRDPSERLKLLRITSRFASAEMKRALSPVFEIANKHGRQNEH